MKKLALAAALAVSTIAAPAVAQDSSSFAIMHFNMDQDSAGDIRMVPQGLMTAPLNSSSTLAEVFGHLNMDADSAMDLRGTGNGVTIIASDPTRAAEIFRRLMEESREDED